MLRLQNVAHLNSQLINESERLSIQCNDVNLLARTAPIHLRGDASTLAPLT